MISIVMDEEKTEGMKFIKTKIRSKYLLLSILYFCDRGMRRSRAAIMGDFSKDEVIAAMVDDFTRVVIGFFVESGEGDPALG